MSVANRIVWLAVELDTDLESFGEVPETIVPPSPTAAGCASPPLTALPGDDLAPSSVVAAPAASGRIMMVSPISRVCPDY
ncbi:MAG: hypothetical protein WAN02_21065 [Mycobacterium sp.]